jgi:uncharacterized protein (TIGR02145 family)
MKSKTFFLVMTALFVCCYGLLGQNQPSKSPQSPQKTQQSQKPKRPKLPIAYFAKYNLWEDEFAEAHRKDQCSYYSLNEAWQVCPDGYHLPTQEEWAGVFPYGEDWMDDKEGVESVTINGVTKSYYAEYKGNYAIRFKRDPDMQFDNKMLTAFRYETVGADVTSRLKVTCRYLGETFKGTIDDIANESFWASNNKDDVVREFPIAGYMMPGLKEVFEMGGHYWSASQRWSSGNIRAYRHVVLRGNDVKISGDRATYTNYPNPDSKYCVRCIENKQTNK